MNWTSQYALLHRALADGDFESFPRPENSSLEAACASWGALHYALNCLLGWEDVGRGLARWYSEGRSTEGSTVLQLIQQVWGRDDLLDYYAAWAWKPADAGWLSIDADEPQQRPSPAWLAEHSLWPDKQWWETFVRRGKKHRHDPFYGGNDPLHLAIHTGRDATSASRSPIVHIDKATRSVVLITEGVEHYLLDLDVLHSQLPSIGEHSWHMEVFDRRVGWLGNFRRSRETGRCFVGKHSIHMLGNTL